MVDGFLNFDTKVDITGFNKGTKAITKQASKLGGIMGGAFSTAIGLGIAQMTGQIVQSLITVCDKAIDLASDMDEVQNVVDTAFGSMAYKCEEFADIAIDQFGMSKLSAKQTASTYMAMAKSMGLSMDAASDMAIETAKLTGDVASFYNISTDLASTKLKSIFTGETETLKDLGVVMTEVNLQQYALQKGITKSYSAMSQAEKVSLRYNFVMDSLADAQGDFARTSDSWANQTRILSERFKELLGILGGGLIRVLTPVVQLINNILSALITLANAFANTIGKLFGFNQQIKSTVKSTKAAAGAQNSLAKETKGAGKAASESLAAFDKLDVLQQNTASGGGGADAGGGFQMEEIKTPDVKTGVFDEITKSIQRLQPYVDRLKESWNNLKDAFERFTSSPGVQAILSFMKEALSYLAQTYAVAMISVITGLLDILAGALDVVAGVLTWIVGMLTGDVAMAADGFDQAVQGMISIVKGLGRILEGVFIAVLGVDCVTAIKGYLSAAWDWFSKTSVYTQGIQKVLKGLLSFVKGIFTANWQLAWNGVKDIFKGIWNTIVGIVESAVNLIIRAVNWCINQLNRIHVSVPDWVTELTGMTGFGFAIPNLNEVKLPRLASGAVIPPNGEFLAMLGDQKNGRNLEAPEELIRQIVREESGGGDVIINAKGTMGQLIRLLKLEVDRENNRSGKSFARGGAY